VWQDILHARIPKGVDGRFNQPVLLTDIALGAENRLGFRLEVAAMARTFHRNSAWTPPGRFVAFFCSVQAGFVTGQNLLIDGGQYPGTF
jgi:hypothetical protein